MGTHGTRSRLEALAADPLAAGTVRTAQTDVGTMLVHAHDVVISPMLEQEGRWEPDEAAWLRAVLTPGATVVDCGANIGYFSLLAAGIVGAAGRVIALEPEPANLRLLRANLWRNGADNVTVVPAAASDARGLLALRFNRDNNTGDHQVHAEATAGDTLVPALTIDELVAGERVDVVKIDTQGADDAVVRGLRATIGANPDIKVLIEFWLEGMADRGLTPERVLAEYRELGRPLGLLGDGGAVTRAGDEEILATARGWAGQWVNLVLG
jgi:FkbM family methyltransferase